MASVQFLGSNANTHPSRTLDAAANHEAGAGSFVIEDDHMDIAVGQELEFIEPAHVSGRVIEKGTHVRVGFILDELLESEVTVVILGKEPPETLTCSRHVLTLHCIPARKHS
jgi:hypothetical protein